MKQSDQNRNQHDPANQSQSNQNSYPQDEQNSQNDHNINNAAG